jgi:hypothetical protein
MQNKGVAGGRSYSPNLFGAHRYTTVGGMCALRGVLQTAVACRGQPKGETTLVVSRIGPVDKEQKISRNLIETERIEYL